MRKCCCMGARTTTLVVGWIECVALFFCVIFSISFLVMMEKKNNGLGVMSMILLLTAFSVGLTSSILLIYGTIKKRHMLMLPWLISWVFLMIVGSIICAIPIIMVSPFSVGWTTSLTVISVGGLSLAIYIFLVILSLYKDIKKNKTILPTTMPNNYNVNYHGVAGGNI